MPHKPGQHGEIAVSNQVPKDDGVQIFTICCLSGVYYAARLLYIRGSAVQYTLYILCVVSQKLTLHPRASLTIKFSPIAA